MFTALQILTLQGVCLQQSRLFQIYSTHGQGVHGFRKTGLFRGKQRNQLEKRAK